MDAQFILANIRRHVTLRPEEEDFLLAILISATHQQGEIIHSAGDVTRGMIHVNSGCLMTSYMDSEGDEKVIQFATAGWWTGDLHSLTTQEPSIFTTRALADSESYLLPGVRLNELLERYPVFERYFRITFQNSLVTHQRRLIQAYSYTAEERYDYFQKKYPHLEQFVPLKHVASYLGITPEFLSKIRRKRSGR